MNFFIKRYLLVSPICFVVLLGADAFAITPESSVNAQSSVSVVRPEKTSVEHLLSWQENRMVTTKGTFYLSADITVINQSGLEKEDIALQKNPPIVQIDKVGRQIRTITILSNAQ